MPGASEKEILARVLTELRATIQASTSNLPQPATALLTTLQDDLSALYPITPPAVALSPIQQLIPHVQDLTRKLQLPAQPGTGAILPDTGAEDQRVGSPPTAQSEQRVASPILADSEDTDCPTIIPFAALRFQPQDASPYAQAGTTLHTHEHIHHSRQSPPRMCRQISLRMSVNGMSSAWCTTAAKSLTAPSCNFESNGRHSKARCLPILGYPGIPRVCC